jgi:hypothetical protein
MVHNFGYDQILPELIYKQRDLRVEHEFLSGSASVPDTADIDSVEECCWG